MNVEVVFALPETQVLVTVELDEGATVQDAIDESGLVDRFPDDRLDALPAGIWGHPVERNRALSDGDRVEIYRPLAMDPREARRQRSGSSS
ncbi:MAG: RnfH family protein [Woeseiaceae bacterium]|nr:RnfH family protein [Woeseiaceae bacterium]